jgi:hypothetical protein
MGIPWPTVSSRHTRAGTADDAAFAGQYAATCRAQILEFDSDRRRATGALHGPWTWLIDGVEHTSPCLRFESIMAHVAWGVRLVHAGKFVQAAGVFYHAAFWEAEPWTLRAEHMCVMPTVCDPRVLRAFALMAESLAHPSNDLYAARAAMQSAALFRSAGAWHGLADAAVARARTTAAQAFLPLDARVSARIDPRHAEYAARMDAERVRSSARPAERMDVRVLLCSAPRAVAVVHVWPCTAHFV